MNIGTEDKKKLAILGVVGALAVAAAIYMYNELATPDVPKSAAAPVVNTVPAPTVSKTNNGTKGKGDEAPVSQDPTLKMGPMLLTESLVYSGSGRNIFSATSAPIDIPKPIALARPKVLPPAPPPMPTGPPPPPPIDLKFFGTATATKGGKRQALLLHGDDVFLATDGDVVQRRYRVVSVAANSIVVEDLTNNNRQTLPLLTH